VRRRRIVRRREVASRVDGKDVRARDDALLREGRACIVRADREFGDGVRGERPAHGVFDRRRADLPPFAQHTARLTLA